MRSRRGGDSEEQRGAAGREASVWSRGAGVEVTVRSRARKEVTVRSRRGGDSEEQRGAGRGGVIVRSGAEK